MRGSILHQLRAHRRRAARTAAAAAAAALLFPLVSASPPASAGVRHVDALQQAFAEAAERHRVPESVLLSVSYLQSRWDGHHGAPSVSGGYGPMHLTDAVTALAEASTHHHDEEDARGDTGRPLPPMEQAAAPLPKKVPAQLRTLDRAASLTGLPASELRQDAKANVQGGAALLAAAQKKLGQPLSENPSDWYGAVASYSGAADRKTATVYANDVFDVIRTGEQRVTDTGQRVTLTATPDVRARSAQLDGLRLRPSKVSEELECPASIACEWIPAPYKEYQDANGQTDYGNHDKGNRPTSQKVDYIIVHDTEGYWDTALRLVQDPTYVSWHYTLRSSDGHIAQHIKTKDVGWHAGNWFVNAKSIGLEHEGFLAAPDAWYTEAMYRTSARLVTHLARQHDVPLDRQHILGHDNVPGVTTANIPRMHTDPGPYWDWQHYFTLLGAPFLTTAEPDSGLVTIRPDYTEHQPVYTRCDSSGNPCAPHGSGAVRLHTEPSADAPLVKDIGLRPNGEDSTNGVNDTGARASTGQRYAVADRKGDWTAIWYLGQRAWFHNPSDQPTAVPSKGRTLTPREGLTEIPVYGRAYPEAGAYPSNVPVQQISPLPYKLLAGQQYAVGLETKGEYYYATTFDTANHQVIRGQESYYQIQFGHRVAFVKASDVRVLP